jgi:hypothetical protein
MNLMHNKLRNRLSSTRVDKLQFIYINQRVLQRAQGTNWKPLNQEKVAKKLYKVSEEPLPDPGGVEELPEGFGLLLDAID